MNCVNEFIPDRNVRKHLFSVEAIVTVMSKVMSLITTDRLTAPSAEHMDLTSANQSENGNTRELVVEVESVRTVRKRSRTTSLFCERCRAMSEFIKLGDASTVFEVDIGELAGFIEANRCHYKQHANGSIYICLLSLLRLMQQQASG